MKGTDEEETWQWFDRLAQIVHEYSISSSNIFNMDETGFMLGVGGSQWILVPGGDRGALFKGQPGNREWATAIECIRTGGQVLLPLIITKGKVHTVGEHQRMLNVPSTWHFSKSEKG